MKHENKRVRGLFAGVGATVAALGLAAAVFTGGPAPALAQTAVAPARVQKAAGQVSNIFLGVGRSESERCLSWISTSKVAGKVQYVVAPEGFKSGDAFPTTGDIVTVDAKVSEARRGKDKEVPDTQTYYANKASISALKPQTTYVYRVGNDDAWSDAIEFTTGAFGSGKEFSFLMAGDPQVGKNLEKDAAGWKKMLDACQGQFPEAAFLFSMGDEVQGKDDEHIDDMFDIYMAPNAIRTMAQAVEVGNHDEGEDDGVIAPSAVRYSDYFTNPGSGTLGQTQGAGALSGDYWFKYNGALFMSLNSNDKNVAHHKEFMQKAIAENPDATWTIASFHHSIYSMGKHYADEDLMVLRDELSPVFSELDVDAVLMGHDHNYTRTYLMNGTEPVIPEGADVSQGQPAPSEAHKKTGEVLYMTADSSSGSKYYETNEYYDTHDKPRWAAVNWQGEKPSITKIKVTDGSLTFDSYCQEENGELIKFDTFTLTKGDSIHDIHQAQTDLALALDMVESQKLVADDFDPEVWAKASKVFADAHAVADDPKASVKELKDAAGSVLDAYDALVADIKGSLRTLVDSCNALSEGDFTPEAWKTFSAKLARAKELVKSDAPTAREYVDAYHELKAAAGDKLGGSGSGKPDGGTPEGGAPENGAPENGGSAAAPENGAAEGKPGTQRPAGGKPAAGALPQTGDGTIFLVGGVAVLAAAAVAAGICLKRRDI